jgi:hypothetical protein
MTRHAWRRAAVVVCALLTAGAPAGADDAPLLTVRGRAEIDVEPLRPTTDGIIFAGSVRDRTTGQLLADAPIEVVLGAASAPARTDRAGRFELELPSAPGAQDLRVSFAGTRHYPPATYERARIDAQAQPLELELSLPAEVDIGGPPLELVVSARSEGRPATVSAEVWAGQDAGSLSRVAELRLSGGRGVVAIEAAELGAPGRAVLAVTARGRGYQATRAEAEIAVTSATSISLETSRTSVDFGDQLVARGRLADARAEAIAGAVVAIEGRGHELAAALTGHDGSFSARIPAAELGEGEIALSARFEPLVAHLAPSRSAPVVVAVGAVRPIPLAYTLAAFAAAALLALVFGGARALPARRSRGRSHRTADRRREQPSRGRPGGLIAAPLRRGGRLRPASDNAVTGKVIDAVTDQPVAGAQVELRLAAASAEPTRLATSDGGRFAIELERGAWQVEISAFGYVRERFQIEIPHRGELRDMAVALVPVRERIFSRYRDVAAPLLPSPDLWGIWTPRQILERVRKGRPAPALTALTDRVEEAYFSARTPVEDELAGIEELVAAARAQPR